MLRSLILPRFGGPPVIWETLGPILDAINGVLWHDSVLFAVLGIGVLFTVWSRFCQYRALTHGVAVTRGAYDHRDDPGAVNHFQALSAALSGTVGLGNIAGVSVAVALGGPGAVFWMWMVGLVGMAIKTTEVIQSMLYRSVEVRNEPHGGPMWVVSKGLAKWSPKLAPLGYAIGAIFCVTTIVSAITGGNMFQAWNVGNVTKTYFGVPEIVTGILVTVLVGAVVVGGIQRIGAIAGRLVPFMCITYLIAGLYVVIAHIGMVPEIFGLIVSAAFSPSEAQGAFVGGTAGSALLWGMKRALFSSEVGQGSSPMAHSAAKTDEPVREGLVAGLEPFIDTLVVCTVTAFVVLLSGAWNRGPEAVLSELPKPAIAADGKWQLEPVPLPTRSADARRVSGEWVGNEQVYLQADLAGSDGSTERVRVYGDVRVADAGHEIVWKPVAAGTVPVLRGPELWVEYTGASLTGHAFDRVQPGLGKWLVVLACWLFAVSTIISWSYYGEQAVVFLFGARSVLPYRVIYSALCLLATAGWITTDVELDSITALGTGVMLVANIPIMLLFSPEAMREYRRYIGRLDKGEFDRGKPQTITDVVEGRSKD
jgi:AGCS family alanine or glycine:cation symporter